MNLALHELEHRARIIQELEEVPRVLGSESQLGQVCLNLLLNAGQAMTGGDTGRNELVLRTRQREDGWVMLEVADTGRARWGGAVCSGSSCHRTPPECRD